MPWRLVKFIIIFAVLLFFIIFNYDNKSDINFGFFKIRDIPVFITVFASFLIGLLCVFPFLYRKNKKKKFEPGAETERGDPSGSGNYGID